MARHYQPMKRFYMHYRTQDKHLNEKFELVWIGATLLFLKSKYPDAQIVPVRFRAKRGDVLELHGLFVLGGTDKVGLRLFACSLLFYEGVLHLYLSVKMYCRLTLWLAGFQAYQQRDSQCARQQCLGRNV